MQHIVPLSNCDWYDGGPGPNVTLRQAADRDEAFLRKLHREAMGPHVEAALGWWDTDEQEKRFAKAAVSWHQIIVLDGHPIGCLLLLSKSNAVILSRIWIIPSVQGRGIGTHLVLQVCKRAQEDGCPVRLQVPQSEPGPTALRPARIRNCRRDADTLRHGAWRVDQSMTQTALFQ